MMEKLLVIVCLLMHSWLVINAAPQTSVDNIPSEYFQPIAAPTESKTQSTSDIPSEYFQPVGVASSNQPQTVPAAVPKTLLQSRYYNSKMNENSFATAVNITNDDDVKNVVQLLDEQRRKSDEWRLQHVNEDTVQPNRQFNRGNYFQSPPVVLRTYTSNSNVPFSRPPVRELHPFIAPTHDNPIQTIFQSQGFPNSNRPGFDIFPEQGIPNRGNNFYRESSSHFSYNSADGRPVSQHYDYDSRRGYPINYYD